MFSLVWFNKFNWNGSSRLHVPGAVAVTQDPDPEQGLTYCFPVLVAVFASLTPYWPDVSGSELGVSLLLPCYCLAVFL